MYLDKSKITIKGKTYQRYLLRESYREGGKVKHRTIANISHCSSEEIEAIELALKHKKEIKDIKEAIEAKDNGVLAVNMLVKHRNDEVLKPGVSYAGKATRAVL